MDLERELRALAERVEWPPAPPLRLELSPRRRRHRRRLVLAYAVLAAALAAALAVPQSRGAILRFLHLRGETVEIVDRLPPAAERPLGVGLGGVVGLAEAKLSVPELLLPALTPLPQLHVRANVVSLVFSYRGRPVLLSEYRFAGGALLKKLAGGATRIQSVRVRRAYGLWLEGLEHVVFFPGAPPRLAGHVLVWETGAATYRLEGKSLSKVDALALAESLRPIRADTP